MKKRVLLVEDDAFIRLIIEDGLQKEGFEVAVCDNGKQAITLLESFTPDMTLLDVNLTDELTGFDVAKAVRKLGNTPIIFTTSRDHIRDIEVGFGFGNCDYLKKPFTCTELIIRMKRLLETNCLTSAATLQNREFITLGEYSFYYREQTIKGNDIIVTLTKMEKELLLQFAQNIGIVLDKQEVIIALWGDKLIFEKSASLNNLICSLRNKLKATPQLQLISIAKTGYKFEVK